MSQKSEAYTTCTPFGQSDFWDTPCTPLGLLGHTLHPIFYLWVEYGLARFDRLVFYNAYAVWRENQGKAGANLQDSRFQFRSAVLECTREFARRAMAAGIAKRSRAKQMERMRSVVINSKLSSNAKEGVKLRICC